MTETILARSAHSSTQEKAILYARVSTPGQEKKGFSLGQQLDALRAHCAAEGIDVVEEIVDPGQSGASLERPGLDRVRDLVTAGGVSQVLTQDADRITRDPSHRALLDDELAEYGAKLAALDDWGDDSHEGSLLKYIRGWQAKGERLKIAERTRRGKLSKAKQGKLIGGSRPAYGFDFAPGGSGRDQYLVNAEEMAVVREVFRLIGDDHLTVHGTARSLDRRGFAAPGNGNAGTGRWNQTNVRRVILNDLFKPLSLDELRAEGVEESVLANLNPEGVYGIWWYGTQRIVTKQVAEPGPNGVGKVYKARRKHSPKPREEWVAVPVELDAAVCSDRALVERARERIKDNVRVSSAGHRFWILSSLVFCSACGRRMSGCPGSKGANLFYYRCRSCSGGNTHGQRAEVLEARVRDAVRSLRNGRDEMTEAIRASFERDRAQVRVGINADTAAKFSKRLEDLENERRGYLRQNARGVLSDADLDALLAEMDDSIRGTKDALREVSRCEQSLSELDEAEQILLDYIETEDGEEAWEVEDEPPEVERERYIKMGLKVECPKTGDPRITGRFGELYASESYHSEHTSTSLFRTSLFRERNERADEIVRV